uniref:Mitochondrial carrier protein PET8 n=1 Tax=Plectus sambesii TaxID=2011161 RepID=A0A914W6T9_9BILA
MSSSSSAETSRPVGYMRSLPCGACAGLAVDMTLYPLDTIKTRLQAEAGFAASGGFKRIYAGLPSVAIGSAPGAALFFCTYEMIKAVMADYHANSSISHMAAASCGEVMACLVRVPTEVVKQRAQAFPNRRVMYVARKIIATQGLSGFYRGYASTVAREIPFSLIQFPLWEAMKRKLAELNNRKLWPVESASCGSVAGAMAAAVTTPLDVAKTRIMLSEKLHGPEGNNMTVRGVLTEIFKLDGVRGLFAGVVPRTIWMALGGFVFFGAYESALSVSYFLHPHSDDQLKDAPFIDRLSAIAPDHRILLDANKYYQRPDKPLFGPEMMAETQRMTDEQADFNRRRNAVLLKEKEEFERLRLQQQQQLDANK